MKELRALAYASLVWGGFLVITYVAFCYFAIWRHEFLPVFPEGVNRVPLGGNESAIGVGNPRFRMEVEPISVVFSPQALGVLLTGVLFLINGYYLLKHLRHKDKAETRSFVLSSLLTDEEKTIYDELVKADGELTQKQLSLNTGFSAVKTYRVLKRLESKNVLKTHPFGMTKKVVLTRE